MKILPTKRIYVVLMLCLLATGVSAQRKLQKPSRKKVSQTIVTDSTKVISDSLLVAVNDSALAAGNDTAKSVVVTKTKVVKAGKDWSTWRPDPKRALWLALVFPSGTDLQP